MVIDVVSDETMPMPLLIAGPLLSNATLVIDAHTVRIIHDSLAKGILMHEDKQESFSFLVNTEMLKEINVGDTQ